MNCREIQEYLSAAVDGRLEEAWKGRVDLHIAQCPSCRNEFELEQLTKTVIAKKLPSQRVPNGVRQSIVQQLPALHPVAGAGGWSVWSMFENFFAPPLVKPALALAVIVLFVIIGISFFTRQGLPPKTETHVADVVEQAVQHYSSYLGGSVNLQLVSSNHDEVRSFFQEKVNFAVNVPKMPNSELIGGVLCEHEGTKFLNLVYRVDDRIVYLYIACSKEMKASGKITLSANAQRDLKESGWHFDTSHPERSIAVWEENDEICSAVAAMDKDELLTLLKE